MPTADVSKIKKIALPKINFLLNVFSENGVIFVWMGLRFEIVLN